MSNSFDQQAYEREHGQDAWDERYRSKDQIWSGRPNAALVAEVSDLAPGTALDAGSGEGADACWLAARGWQVTGLDFAQPALDRAEGEARRLGLDITWVQLDVTREAPVGQYDLVTTHFLQLPRSFQQRVFRSLAAVVAPGGTLLVVGHDFSDLDTTVERPHLHDMGWTANEIAGLLDDSWTIQTAEARPRSMVDGEGQPVTIHDAVLRARRAARE